jgi:endonuclease III
MTQDQERMVKLLLDRYGSRYAEEAGIQLGDTPGPLYQLLVLATLLSARISAGLAVRAARELFAAGYRTPAAMAAASWQDRVDALGRGGYRRYDESTATRLGNAADLLIRRWRGDLRGLRRAAGEPHGDAAALLMEFPGIGPAGASIFLREVQDVWPELSPYADGLMARGARRLGLPDDHRSLSGLLAASGEPATLAAALVRVALSQRAAAEMNAEATTSARP